MATPTAVVTNTAMAPSFPTSTSAYPPSASSCPSCGYQVHLQSDLLAEAAEARRRIRDLESQVKLLNTKGASAADKLADYEDEIRYLRDAYARSQQQVQGQGQGQVTGLTSPPLEGPGPAIAPVQPAQQQQLSRLASLSSFLPGRRKEVNQTHRPTTPATGTLSQNNSGHSNNTLSPPKTPFSLDSTANNSAPTLQPTPPGSQITLSSLQASLEEERTLRMRAESSLSQTQTELEELTAQLFGQANEMVATERKARAKLEERVKVLEQRDVEKRKRLERLEKAVTRIERVRGMVGP